MRLLSETGIRGVLLPLHHQKESPLPPLDTKHPSFAQIHTHTHIHCGDLHISLLKTILLWCVSSFLKFRGQKKQAENHLSDTSVRGALGRVHTCLAEYRERERERERETEREGERETERVIWLVG